MAATDGSSKGSKERFLENKIQQDEACPSDKSWSSQSSNDAEAHIKKLNRLITEYLSSRENPTNVEKFLFKLKSQRLRNRKSSLDFYHSGGVESLLQLSHRLHKDSDKESNLLSIVWGTLANVCSFEEEIQQKIAVSAIPDICEILCKCAYPKVLNTVCRIVGNISSFLKDSYKGKEIIVVREITRIIGTYKDSGCLQSALRAIRKISHNGVVNEELRISKTIITITNTLLLHDKCISEAALKTLVEITCYSNNCDLSLELWSQQDVSPLRVLVECITHSCMGITSRDSVIMLLCRCIRHVDGKAAVSRAGGIENLIDFIGKCSKSSDLYSEVLDSLCLCCRDVHGRQKMRDFNGLQLLIDLVCDDELRSHHEKILSALICYYFDEYTLQHMLKKLNLMKSLVFHLKTFTNQLKNQPVLSPGSEGVEKEVIATEPDSETPPGEMLFSSVDHSGCSSAVDFDIDELSNQSMDILVDTPSSPSPVPSMDELVFTSVTPCDKPKDTISITSPLYTPLNFKSFASTDYGSAPSEDTAANISVSDDFLKSCLSQTPPNKQVPLDIDTSTPMPANFIDSLLSSPTPYTTINPTSSFSSSSVALCTDIGDPIESKVLLLVSRLSHLHDCQPILAMSETFNALLQYFFASNGSNCTQIFKILGRIFINPLCFQDCLNNHAPSLIFMYIKSHEGDCSSPCPTTAFTHQAMCRELFDKLSHVAKSPFGQGVIAHMLLRGDEKEKTAGTLSLSLLQKSPVVCHRMLTSYNGFHNLISLSQRISTTSSQAIFPVDDQLQESAMILLLTLAYRYYTNPPPNKRRHSLTIQANDNSPLPKKANHNHSLRTQTIHTNIESSSKVMPERFCQYKDIDHYPFDLIITVESNQGITHQFPVHRSIFIESSDVFAVMLEGSYQESQLHQIYLRSLEPSVFCSCIHHVYGCCKWSWDKCCAIEYTPNNSDIDCPSEQTLIHEIIAPLTLSSHKQSSYHYLLLLECANRFNLSSLMLHCEARLVHIISEDNLVPMFAFSAMLNCHSLPKQCVAQLLSLCHAKEQSKLMLEILQCSDAPKFTDILHECFHIS